MAKISGERINRRMGQLGKRITLYLDKAVYEDFKVHCKPHSASSIMDELMKAYMATSKGPMRAKYKRAPRT